MGDGKLFSIYSAKGSALSHAQNAEEIGNKIECVFDLGAVVMEEV